MTYHSYTEKELLQAGVQEGELAIYTGTVNPRQTGSLSPGVNSKNAYVYLWRDGWPQELDVRFRRDRAGADTLEAWSGGEEYAFLRDEPSGYIRQVSGPASPIVLANIGAIPLRVDTFLGRFTVHAGTMLRLDASVPQREKKKILLIAGSRCEWPLESAELWDGRSWRRLDICAKSGREDRSLTVRDGSAVVQSIVVQDTSDDGRPELLMMDPPEPDPDYEIYITGKTVCGVTLCFNRSDYRNGRAVQRRRTISFVRWGEPVAYDLQKLRESHTQRAADQCTAELPGREAVLVSEKEIRPLSSEKLWTFLEEGDEPGGLVLGTGEIDAEPAWQMPQPQTDGKNFPAPEPPENFPE